MLSKSLVFFENQTARCCSDRERIGAVKLCGMVKICENTLANSDPKPKPRCK